MSDKAKAGRRDFLKLASLGAVAGGVAMAAGQTSAEADEAVSDTSAGYRETEHVKKYYELARF
jgi:hypothetical protein